MDLTQALMMNGYRVDFSHKFRKLRFPFTSYDDPHSSHKHQTEHWPLEGTVAGHPIMYGHNGIAGFYSAYFMDVTRMELFVNKELKKFGYLYTATH